VRPVRELAGAHAREQIEVLGDGAVTIRAVSTRLGQRAAVRANFVRVEAVDVGLAFLDQPDRELIHLVEVVGGEEQGVPFEAEPPDVFLDGVDVLDVFLGRIRVVEPQVAGTARLLGDPEVEADRLRMADVEIPVGFRRKTGRDPPLVLAGCQVVSDDRANEVDRRLRRGRGVLVSHL
jgi:hypothetical protein